MSASLNAINDRCPKFFGSCARHLLLSCCHLQENRTHQQCATWTNGRSYRTPLCTQDPSDKGAMDAGGTTGLSTCPLRTPRDLLNVCTHEVWMVHRNRAINEP